MMASEINPPAAAANAPAVPSHLDMFQPGEKFFDGEEELRKAVIAVLSPLGINRLVLDARAEKNHDETTKEAFPRYRFILLCGQCDTETRKMDTSVRGCC